MCDLYFTRMKALIDAGGKTTGSAKTGPPRKSDASRRYYGRSKTEYAEQGYEKAIDYLKEVGKTFRKGVAHMGAVREAIEGLPSDAVLTTTVVDFWLALTSDRVSGDDAKSLRRVLSPENSGQRVYSIQTNISSGPFV